MYKKICSALILGLVSANSVYAMMDDNIEEQTSRTMVRVQDHEALDRASESLEATFAPTRTQKIKDGLWAHVYVTRTAIKAHGKAWTTKYPDEYSERVNVDSIQINLDWGMHESKTAHNTSFVDVYLYATGGAFTRAKASGWFTGDFGVYGPVEAKTKH